MSKASLIDALSHDLHIIARAARGSSEQTFVHQEEKIIENVHSQYWTVENSAFNLAHDSQTAGLSQRALNAATRAETVISILEAHHHYWPDTIDGGVATDGSVTDSVVLTDVSVPVEIADSTIVGSVDLAEGGTIHYT